MPTISRFRGISILMFINDHPPPHFHAEYGEYEAKLRIADGEMFEGEIQRPPTAWCDNGISCIKRNCMRIGKGLSARLAMPTNELPNKIQPL